MAYKRPSEALVAVPDVKRARNELVAITNRDKALLEAVSSMCELEYEPHSDPSHHFFDFQGVQRTSSLLSPIMLLEGHEGEIFACEFHPEGDHLMSTGFDRHICTTIHHFPKLHNTNSAHFPIRKQIYGMCTANART